jgi:hypothetical protein
MDEGSPDLPVKQADQGEGNNNIFVIASNPK